MSFDNKDVEREGSVEDRAEKTGLPPGTLVHVGERRAEDVEITVIDYDENEFNEEKAESVEDCLGYRDKESVTWINVEGLHDTDVIQQIGDHYGFHSLMLEDILNTTQRPKMDDYETHLMVAMKMISYEEEHTELHEEHVSLILGKDFVISFQETQGDVWDPVRERIRRSRGRIRGSGADYLVYALMDAIVDSYFEVLEKIGDELEFLDETLVEEPTHEILQDIHDLKREMIYLRRSVWPLREVVSGLERQQPELVAESTRIYLRDVYDHTIQIIDTIESYRDVLASMVDIYLSSVSNKTNEIMQVLTVIATIFIPLTFIAGVYGMNFEYMPELGVWWAYPAVLLLMAAVAGVMLGFFRRHDWL